MAKSKTGKTKKVTNSKRGGRPAFLDKIGEFYGIRRKNAVLLTGDVSGLFWNRSHKNFVDLERTLYGELSDKFNMVRLDIAKGFTFYDDGDEAETIRICECPDSKTATPNSIRNFKNEVERNRNYPLVNLVLLEGMISAFERMKHVRKEIKPLCVVIQYAGAFFSRGEYSHLPELDRQRLISFLNLIESPTFKQSPCLIILINSVKSEVSDKITSLPNVAHVEIALPTEDERSRFVTEFTKENRGIKFESGKNRFCGATAGLTLNNVNDILEVATSTKAPVTKEQVVSEVNAIIQAQLGSIIRVRYPAHTPDDIIGYKKTGKIFRKIFARCEDPKTAIAAMLISGPNGGGKTFQAEAWATQSGRVVIELAGMRGSYFGETDKFFELFRWHVETFGKILILVDEAHTAFGSVHSSDTHKTEKRLSGNIIKMMGDPTMFGKVLWGMMTSRPDELDPDIKSRSPIQVPIFDMEGDERKQFVGEMFDRKSIKLTDEELDDVLGQTDYYSARDYDNLVKEVLAERGSTPDIGVLDVLAGWQASRSIQSQREFQSLIAALHCSYPGLLPDKYRELKDTEIMTRIEELKFILQH